MVLFKFHIVVLVLRMFASFSCGYFGLAVFAHFPQGLSFSEKLFHLFEFPLKLFTYEIFHKSRVYAFIILIKSLITNRQLIFYPPKCPKLLYNYYFYLRQSIILSDIKHIYLFLFPLFLKVLPLQLEHIHGFFPCFINLL